MILKLINKHDVQHQKIKYNSNFYSNENSNIVHIKGTEATCVEIATEMKNALNWKTCSIAMFYEIFSPFKYISATLFRKLTFLACNNNQVYAAILEFPKIMIFFRTAKPTLARFLKYPEISLIWFLYDCKCSALAWSEDRRQARMEDNCCGYSLLQAVMKL